MLSGTITDYDADTNVFYSDSDNIDIDAGSIMSLYVSFSHGCVVRGSHKDDWPGSLTVTMNFTPAPWVEPAPETPVESDASPDPGTGASVW